jgi:hypothetical protein
VGFGPRLAASRQQASQSRTEVLFGIVAGADRSGSAPGKGWRHMPDGCGAETTKSRAFGFRAFVGKTSMDFSLSALRFIVAVSFFGFNVRLSDSLMNSPLEFPGPWTLRRNCTDVESKLCGLTVETTQCCETETQRVAAG